MLVPSGSFRPTVAAAPFEAFMCKASSTKYVPVLYVPLVSATVVSFVVQLQPVRNAAVACTAVWSIVGLTQGIFAAFVVLTLPHQCGLQSVAVSITAACLGIAAVANAVASSSVEDNGTARVVSTLAASATAAVSSFEAVHAMWLFYFFQTSGAQNAMQGLRRRGAVDPMSPPLQYSPYTLMGSPSSKARVFRAASIVNMMPCGFNNSTERFYLKDVPPRHSFAAVQSSPPLVSAPTRDEATPRAQLASLVKRICEHKRNVLETQSRIS